MPTARTKNDGCSIILHQTNDGYYHWLCPNCKCENVAPVSGVDISQYLPIVKCHECGFEFGVDKSALPTATETTERDLITEVEELLAKATPGPWEVYPDSRPDVVTTANVNSGYMGERHLFSMDKYGESWGQEFNNEDDARLIAAAPDLLRRLVEDNKRLREENTALRECDACERKAVERVCRRHGGRP